MLVTATERIAGVVEIFDGILDNSTEIIRFLEDRAEWNHATVIGADGAVQVAEQTRNNDVAFYQHSCLRIPPIIYGMIRTVYEYLDDYAARYNITFNYLEPVNINRYLPEQQYHLHADDGPGLHRIISALLYLNDVDEGGETVFPIFDVSVKPRAGRLVIFPSNYAYAHIALPPVSDWKYSVAFWVGI